MDRVTKIFSDHPVESKLLMEGKRELFMLDNLYYALYELLVDEMPYGVAKARTGDPVLWIMNFLEEENYI